MKQIPFWVDDSPRPVGLTSDLPSETDYLIVGSGLTGLSAALRLSEAGNSVTIIDAGEIGGGASSMNGGMVSSDVKAGVDTVHATLGPKIAAEMWKSTVNSVDSVRKLNERPGIDAITHDAGIAALGRGSKDLKAFDRSVAWYDERFPAERRVVDAREIGELVGGSYFNVAKFERDAIGVHPARLTFGLASEVKEAGALLVDECAAVSLDKATAGMTVETSKGTVKAGTVIVATNGYTTRKPSKELARLVVPIGSYMIATEPLEADLARSIFPTGVTAYTKKRLLNYMRLGPDNRVMIGGRRNLHTDLDLAESARDLRNSLITFWPELADAEITHAWGGQLAVPFDLIPHIGRVDGAWYAMGYGGHGVGLATQLGIELAGMLLGEDPPSVYSKIPHNGRFYYSGGKPWFLTPASILYRMLDRVGV